MRYRSWFFYPSKLGMEFTDPECLHFIPHKVPFFLGLSRLLSRYSSPRPDLHKFGQNDERTRFSRGLVSVLFVCALPAGFPIPYAYRCGTGSRSQLRTHIHHDCIYRTYYAEHIPTESYSTLSRIGRYGRQWNWIIKINRSAGQLSSLCNSRRFRSDSCFAVDVVDSW